MDEIPPGIEYLIKTLPGLATPALITYLVSHAARTFLELHIPAWLLWTGVSLSLPIWFTASVLFIDWKDHWDAAKLGAALAPRLKDPYPGGLRTLKKGAKLFRNAPIGSAIATFTAETGTRTFNTRTLFQNRIITDEPEHLQAILATQFDDHDKGPEIGYLLHPLLGTGVFNSDGDMWKFHRTLTRPFFARDRLSSISHFSTFTTQFDLAYSSLSSRFKEGHPVDFQEVAARFTLGCALEILLGWRGVDDSTLKYPFYVNQALGSQDTGDEWEYTWNGQDPVTMSQFVPAFVRAQYVTAHRMRYSVHWPLTEFWEDKLKKPMKVVHGFIDGIVKQALERKKEIFSEQSNDDKLEEEEEETLLESLVKETEEILDPIILRDEIMNMVVAGRDTTACLLTFSIYMLADHPHVLKKLRDEILENIGPNKIPTFDDLKGMKYLRAVLNETLRLFPPVPFNVRRTNKPVVWPAKSGKPYYIPARSRTPISVYTMQRRKDLWGLDDQFSHSRPYKALDFDPDRFIDDRLHKYLVPNPFIYLPFNAGPRICLGQQFAYNEASFFLVRLLQEFQSISLVPEAIPLASRPPREWAETDKKAGATRREKIWVKSHFTMYAQDGLWVALRKAKTSEEF
ncbi:cytochrome P450 [Crepidotus variabilis]|uniref:Cytochrome P450 n=1 Tax=Crepidotus variabilis TaxID=179855 RepID=A0A9P6EKY8_9AGAR|nr:cytochrome P450 [Crepidotus variabilis]